MGMAQILQDFEDQKQEKIYIKRVKGEDFEKESYQMMEKFIENNTSENDIKFFQVLTKIYSGPLYQIIGNTLSECNYRSQACYIAGIINCANKWKDTRYKLDQKPVWRGQKNNGNKNLDNFATNKIGKYCRLTSTSQEPQVAITFGSAGCDKAIIYKIFMAKADNNEAATNIDLTAATSKYEG